MNLVLASSGTSGLDVALFKEIGLLVFFGIFLVVALWLLFSRSPRYRAAARMPLDDDAAIDPPAGAPTADVVKGKATDV